MQAPKWKLVHISHLISVQKRGCLHKQRLVSPREENGKGFQETHAPPCLHANGNREVRLGEKMLLTLPLWVDSDSRKRHRDSLCSFYVACWVFCFSPQVGACGNCICLLVQFFPLMKMSSRSWIHKQCFFFLMQRYLNPFTMLMKKKRQTHQKPQKMLKKMMLAVD